MHGSALPVRKQLIRRSVLLAAAIAALPFGLSAPAAHAANLTWDNNGATAPNPQDGAGAWDTALLNFFDGTNNVSWNNANNDTAVFGAGGTGGAVTVATGITIGGLTLNATSYSFTGGSFVVNNPGQISITAGIGTINTPITGSAPIAFNIGPSSTLSLTGTNTYTGTATFSGGGTINVNAQTVLNGTGSIVLSGVTFNSSATLNPQPNAFVIADSTTNSLLLPNNGTFNGAFSGGGTLIFGSGGKTYSFQENLTSSFTGTITMNATAATIRFTNAGAQFPGAKIDLGTGAGSLQNRANNGTIQIGALFGGPSTSITGSQNSSNTGQIVYEVGAAGIDSTFNGAIADGNASTRKTGLSKVGNDTWTLTGTGTYTGDTTVNGGTLAITTSTIFNTTPNIYVNNTGSGILNVSALAGGYTLANGQNLSGDGGHVIGTVNVSNATGGLSPGKSSASTSSGTLTIDNLNLSGGSINIDINGGSSDLINVTNTLTLNSGTIFITPNNTAGTFRIINYPANSPHGSLSNISAVFGGRVTSGSGLTDNPSTGQIDLTISGFAAPEILTWNGTANGNWDVQVSGNWSDDLSPNDKFFAADSVNFLDGAGLQTTISKVGLLQPTNVTINADTNNYTIGDTGTIQTTGALVKLGAGIATLSSANSLGIPPTSNPPTFTFGASVGGGTLVLGANAAISSSGTVAIAVGNGAVMLAPNISISNQINIFRDNATIGVISGNGTFNGSIDDSTHLENHITHASTTGIMSLANNSLNNFTGTLDFGNSGGSLRLLGSGANGAVSTQAKINLGTGNTELFSRDGNNNSVSIGAISGGPNTTISGPLSTATALTYTVGSANVDSIFSGTIRDGQNASTADSVSIVKIGTGVWTLNGNSTYTGLTTVSGGALIVNGIHAFGGAYTVNGTLGGSGVISAAVTVNSGAHVAPGTGIGALRVGSLSVNGSQLDYEIGGGDADKIVVMNPDSLTLAGTSNINLTESSATYGRYILVDYSGTPLANTSGLALTNSTVNGVTASLQNNTLNTSIDLLVPNPAEVDSQWGVNGAGQWTSNGNWTNNIAPNGVDNVATFGTVLTSGTGTVTLSSPQTVAIINFDSSGAYRLEGGTLNLDASGGYVAIDVASGNQTVAAPVALGKGAVFAVNSGASLNMIGGISGSGKSILKSGGGLLTMSGTNSYSGSTTVNAGTIQVDSNDSIGDGSSGNLLVLSGGALQSNTNFTSPATRGVQVIGAGGTIDAAQSSTVIEVDGAISGYAPLTKVGPGTLMLAGSNTHIGLTTVSAGTIALGASNVIADAAQIAINGATAVLDLGADHTDTVSGVMLDGGGQIIGTGASALSMGAGSYDLRSGTVTVPLNGAAALNKTTEGVVTITASSGYTGATNVSAGTLIARELGGGTLTVTAGTARISEKVGTPNDISGTSVVPALAISSGAVVDLTNNALVINYTTLGSTLTDVRGHLAAGRLISSTTAGGFAVGYADASVLGKTSFGGTAVDNTSVLIGFVYNGDANLDGTVNALDFNALASNFGATTGKVWTQADFNYDGLSNTLDFNALAMNFNKTLSSPPAPALGSLVPEPASLSAIVLIGLAGRRRRRRI